MHICLKSKGQAQDVRRTPRTAYLGVLTFRRATSHNQDMIALLRDLRSQASVEERTKIDNLLAAVCLTFRVRRTCE